MKYALNLSEDNRILSASFCNEFTPEDVVKVDVLPEGNIVDYKYANGEYVHDPLPIVEIEEKPTQLDRIEAQLAYNSIMLGTLIEEA
jgi:hypothetical protein